MMRPVGCSSATSDFTTARACRSLAISSNERSDAEIAWLAYGRWGQDVVEHLAGDFAFVVWDDRRRSLFAARDHLGVRPLYFRVEPERVLISSEVAQILAVAQNPLRIDAESVADMFVGPTRSRRRTFFEGIERLPAGHCLTLNRRVVHQRRYWRPSGEGASGFTYGEHCARIRAVFTEAVRARLESQRPIVAHSSGGFDSSVILMIADQIYGHDPSRPPLVMASATAPGMPCDDVPYMDAVARTVRFEGIRWNVLESKVYGLDDQVLARPGTRTGMGGAEERDLILARERGAGILISGVLGDTVLHANGVMRDMVRGGEWAEVFRFTIGNRRSPAPLRFLMRSLLGYLSPAHALRSLAFFGNRSSWRPSRWMGPRLRELFPLPPPDVEILGSSSHVTADAWARVNSPSTAQVIDTIVAYGTQQGLEVRLPFADHRLVEAILQVPWEDRMPRDDARRLGRDALGALLPVEFATRGDQGSWLPVFFLQAKTLRPAVRSLLRDGQWLSFPYVNQSDVLKMFDRMKTTGEPNSDDVIILTAVGALEAWLRRVRRSVGV